MSPRRPRLPERWYRDVWLLVISGVVALALLSFDGQQKQLDQQTVDIRRNGRAAFRQIEASRIAQTRDACERTNRKILAPLRQQVEQDIRDLERVPPGELERFGFTRAEIEARNRAQLKRVQPVDCERLARRVARSSPDFSP